MTQSNTAHSAARLAYTAVYRDGRVVEYTSAAKAAFDCDLVREYRINGKFVKGQTAAFYATAKGRRKVADDLLHEMKKALRSARHA